MKERIRDKQEPRLLEWKLKRAKLNLSIFIFHLTSLYHNGSYLSSDSHISVLGTARLESCMAGHQMSHSDRQGLFRPTESFADITSPCVRARGVRVRRRGRLEGTCSASASESRQAR
jgi:hypothetical protein